MSISVYIISMSMSIYLLAREAPCLVAGKCADENIVIIIIIIISIDVIIIIIIVIIYIISIIINYIISIIINIIIIITIIIIIIIIINDNNIISLEYENGRTTLGSSQKGV